MLASSSVGILCQHTQCSQKQKRGQTVKQESAHGQRMPFGGRAEAGRVNVDSEAGEPVFLCDAGLVSGRNVSTIHAVRVIMRSAVLSGQRC